MKKVINSIFSWFGYVPEQQVGSWFKIIRVGCNDVLVTKRITYNDGGMRLYDILFECSMDGVIVSLSLSYQTENNRDVVFDDHFFILIRSEYLISIAQKAGLDDLKKSY
jgi:hypothetical protein